tara:strand:- start:263 stop:946 length:684 start_codon:yes stop_codon:yes gene_type:complete
MHIIKADNQSDAWVKVTNYLLSHGIKVGNLTELLNVGIEIHSSNKDFNFDKKFRKIFGDERIDYASSVTFVEPRSNPLFNNDFVYEQNNPAAKWTKTYWGRMINWNGEFNQIEQTIKRLKEHKSSKTIVMSIYDPKTDGKKTMSGMPCLLNIDLKPRFGKLFLTANFRSQAVSKSGYADYTALVDLADFLCEESGLEFGLVTSFAHSCHLRPDNEEKKNSLKLLEIL